MLKIGSIEDNDGEYIIHREFYRQGMIFKDEEAYRFHKDQPCYSPELSDSVYTGIWQMSYLRGLIGSILSHSRKIGSQTANGSNVRDAGKSSIMAMGAMTRNARIAERRWRHDNGSG